MEGEAVSDVAENVSLWRSLLLRSRAQFKPFRGAALIAGRRDS